MKRLKLALVALIIAAGTFGIFAFTDANEPTAEIDVSATTLHWFDAETGQYLGSGTQIEQQVACQEPGPISCAYGYLTDIPDGQPIAITTKQQ